MSVTPQELLEANGIKLDDYAPGQHSTTCPNCSPKRVKNTLKCLSVFSIHENGAALASDAGGQRSLKSARYATATSSVVAQNLALCFSVETTRPWPRNICMQIGPPEPYVRPADGKLGFDLAARLIENRTETKGLSSPRGPSLFRLWGDRSRRRARRPRRGRTLSGSGAHISFLNVSGCIAFNRAASSTRLFWCR